MQSVAAPPVFESNTVSGEIRIVDATTSGLLRIFTIDLDADWVDSTFGTQLKRLARTTRVKGFRTGKAPLSVLRAGIGARLTRDIVDQLAVTVSRKVIKDGQLRPVSRPLIEALTNVEKGQFRFKLFVEVLPEVTLQPMEGFTIERLTASADAQSIAASPGEIGIPAELSDEKVRSWVDELSWLHVKRQVLDWLAEHYKFDVPNTMVDRELSRILKNHREHVDTHVDRELKQRYRAVAERRVRLAIVLLTLGRSYNLQLARQDIGQLVQGTYGNEEGLASLIDFYVDHPTALAELQSPALENAVVALIVRKAQIIDRQVTANELMAVAGEGSLDCERTC